MALDLNPGEQQRQILDAAATMLGQSYPLARLREARSDDLTQIAAFGAFSLALPEEAGGAGFSVLDEALLHVAFGRHLVSSRALATTLAARLALAAGRTDIAHELTEGAQIACAALREGDTILSLDSHGAGLCVVFANRGLGLFERNAKQGAVLRGLGRDLDLHRADAASITPIVETGEADIGAITDLLISAQLLGIAEAAVDLTVDYAKTRQQFGRPIASFQAIKHHCATMAIASEAVSSLLDFAAIALVNRQEDAPFQIAALRRLATQAAFANTRTGIQVHGGIGFSAEADMHRFLKQAHLLSRLGTAPEMLDHPAPLAPYQSSAEDY